mmetsp:Transcript_1087/g.1478  ORF Transcript_1087/g.1478 Transcript_1087/m.1478 type:complete len:110 (+) Transcript_1087:175-504(+)
MILYGDRNTRDNERRQWRGGEWWIKLPAKKKRYWTFVFALGVKRCGVVPSRVMRSYKNNILDLSLLLSLFLPKYYIYMPISTFYQDSIHIIMIFDLSELEVTMERTILQ